MSAPLHVSAPLDAAERAALEGYAERHGLTVATLVRAALLSADLLDAPGDTPVSPGEAE